MTINRQQEFYCRKLGDLAGGTIIGTAAAPDGFFGLVIRAQDGVKRILWILQDDDGNGPGSFDIEVTK